MRIGNFGVLYCLSSYLVTKPVILVSCFVVFAFEFMSQLDC